ncbi:UPF0323 family lipoprotein [Nitratifractor sp.]
MKYLKRLSQYGSGIGLGVLLVSGITGCQQRQTDQESIQPRQQNAFVVIEEVSPGKYKIAEEFPAKETRIILKKLDGTEKVLTREEMDELIKKEAAKIDAGTSNLTRPDGAQMSAGGMSIGEAILASAAGAIIGSWIGSKLFNNQNYRQNRRSGYKTPSAYNRSVNSFKKGTRSSTTRSSTRRSGFFGGSRTGSMGRSGFFGG